MNYLIVLLATILLSFGNYFDILVNMSQQINIQQFPFRSAITIGIIAFIFLVLQSAFVIVDAGHVGVVKRLGAVQSTPLSEGFHLKLPIVDEVIQL